MATEVTLPELGDGIESGDVLEIFVSVGDVIAEGQDIVEMETDKATVPVPSSVGGTVTKILINEGDTVPIGGAILEIEAGATAEAQSPETKSPEPSESEPSESEPSESEPAAPAPATPPPQVALTPPAPPQPSPAEAPEQQSPPPTPAAPAPTAAFSIPAVRQAASSVIPAGPAIRRFAREVGVDLSNVVGSGEGGRITREDILAVVRSSSATARQGGSAPTTPVALSTGPSSAGPSSAGPSSAGPSSAGPSSAGPSSAGPSTNTGPAAADSAAQTLPGTADVDDFGPIRVERMSKIRKTIANQMHVSWTSVPRVTNFDDADITDLERLRQSSKEDYTAQGLKLTTMPFLIKAVATALRHHPTINAVIDQQNEQLIYKDYVNVGIAVDTDRGLVVPVMRDADQMGIPEITRGLAEMAGKVRSGQFSVSDLRGGTFTISNLGAIGGQYSTPIINVPEVAILLVGRSRKLPVVMPDDSIEPRLMMPLSISYDHRLVDGGTAARFLNDVIGFLEAPSRLLLAL